MALTSLDDEGGLGLLASASALVAARPKAVAATRDDDGENRSGNRAVATVPPPQIGLDLSAMELAMAEVLARASTAAGGPRRYCRLCDASSSSYDDLMAHLITSHRPAVLQSMHDLNLAGVLQQVAASTGPGAGVVVPALVASIREIACTTPTAPGLEPYVQKVLDDGPTAWIMEHARAKNQLPPVLCPTTSRPAPGSAAAVNVQVPLASKPVWPPAASTAWARTRYA